MSDDYADTENGHIADVNKMGDRLDRIEAMIDRLLPGHENRDKPAKDEPAMSRGDLEAAVKAEIERGKKEEAEREAAERKKTEDEQLREDVRALKETKPAPQLPRRTRLLGWGS